MIICETNKFKNAMIIVLIHQQQFSLLQRINARICMQNEMFQSFNNYFIIDKFIFERLDQRLCEQFELNSILH
jgi:hypothetical protein